MKHTTTLDRYWRSMRVRLGLILVLLMTITPVTLADRGGGGGRGHHHEIVPVPVAPPRVPTQQHHEARNIQKGELVDPKLRGIHATDPIDMKLLVISADGQETDFQAIKAFLSQIGIPYDTLIATQTPLTSGKLWDGGVHGYYQGILLTTGNLIYYNASTGQWQSAFTDAQWATLWQYESMFGIRQVTLYTYPYGAPDNYGLNLIAYQDTSVTPLDVQLTTAGQQVFSYLNPNNPITIQYAWTYLGTVISPTVTTPLLVTPEGYAIASITKYPDGRQNLAVTTANNPDLMHSMLLSYGLINWVTKGLFLGERHVNMSPQVDDMLIEDDIWDMGMMTDTTGLTYRMTWYDYNQLMAWQAGVQSYTVTKQLTLELAFNGEGASGIYPEDDLTPAVLANPASFNWVNHTYSHENLDAISRALATTELTQNHNMAVNTLHLTNYYKDAMVQPDVSGLTNTNFLWSAQKFGIRYLIADTSRAGWNNPSPNAGFYSTYQPSILIIPRHPANLFYNVTIPMEWISEYNCFYGPNGECAGGRFRYWDHDLSYDEILEKESDMWLRYLLKWDLDPLMFHQANLRAHDGEISLLGDLINRVLEKYNAVYKLPIRGLAEHNLGIQMANRMAYNTSGVTASLIPCAGTAPASVTLRTTKSALIPVTGVAYGTNREVYGGQNISYIQVNSNRPVTFNPPTCP
jgi:hypothetical protein